MFVHYLKNDSCVGGCGVGGEKGRDGGLLAKAKSLNFGSLEGSIGGVGI